MISGVAALDQSWKAIAEEVLEAHRSRLEITYLAGLPMAKVLEEVGRLPRETIVVFLTMRQDGAGEHFEDGRVIAHEIAEAAAAPVYGVYEATWARASSGAYVEPFYATGDAMAALTLRILRGEKAYDLTPVGSPKSYAAEWQALRRWNLDETRLPAETNVLFREPSLWAQYRGELASIALLVGIQTLLIVASLLDIRKRRVERTLSQRKIDIATSSRRRSI